MGLFKCCVGGCSSTNETHRLFSFPKNDNLRNLWMSFLVPTNSILIGLSKEQLLRKRVCEKHFDKDQFDEEGKRLRYSYPCLFTDVEIEHGVPLMPSESDRNALSDHNYCKGNSKEDINVTDEILVLGRAGDDIHGHPLCIHEVNMAVKRQGDVTDQPSCSFSKPLDIEIPTLSEHAENEIVKTTERKYSYERRMKGFNGLAVKTNNFRKTKFVKRVKDITSNSLNQTTTQRIVQAISHGKIESLFKNFGCLSKQAQTFLLMQLKLCNKNKMARRPWMKN